MAWQQEAMIWTNGDVFHRRKYALLDMCADLNGSRGYHLPNSATLNYPIWQNVMALLSKVLKALAKAVDGKGNEGNISFISHSHQPCFEKVL